LPALVNLWSLDRLLLVLSELSLELRSFLSGLRIPRGVLRERLGGRIRRLPSQHVEWLNRCRSLADQGLVEEIIVVDGVIEVLLCFSDLLRGYRVALLVESVEAEHLSDILYHVSSVQVIVLIVLALNAD